jgi:hypothetical protein
MQLGGGASWLLRNRVVALAIAVLSGSKSSNILDKKIQTLDSSNSA